MTVKFCHIFKISVNDCPVAVDDFYRTFEKEPVTCCPLENDYDSDPNAILHLLGKHNLVTKEVFKVFLSRRGRGQLLK